MADEMATSALSGAAMGASAGAVAGPYGALIGGVVGLGYGLYTGSEAEKANKNRPKYEIPPEYLANLTEAEQQALQGLPEQQKQDYINSLNRNTAYSLSALGNRKSGINGVAELNQNNQDAMLKLGVADAQARKANTETLYGIRNQVGDQRTMQFQTNELNPYYENRAQQNAQAGATAQNLAGAGAALGTYYNTRNTGQAKNNNPYYTPSSNSATGMTNYNSNSIENNPYNGLYDNTNTGYDPSTGTYTG